MAKKRIKRLCVRLTTSDEKTLRQLARLAECSESVLVRDLISQAARAMGLLAPELESTNGAIKAIL